MPFIKINDQELEVPQGQTILEAAKSVGIKIPHYCYHRALKIVASCRMCLVEVVGAPKLLTACSTPIYNRPQDKKVENKYDEIIYTESEKVKTARASVLEFILLNHPIDCPICDKAGECKLQDYSFAYGNDESRFIDFKRIPTKKDLGPSLYLYTSRCILCSRCIRFLEEITQTEELKIYHRGSHSEIDVIPGKPLDNKLMGNVVDLCPVGCLIDKHERFEGRVWNFAHTDSICPGCGKGCNITMDVMKKDKLNLEELVDKVYRIRPRKNMDVNQWWICDEGRYHLEAYKDKIRILTPLFKRNENQVEVSWKEALEWIRSTAQSVQPEEIVWAGSPYASNEENYLIAKLARATGSRVDLSKPGMGESQTFTPKNGANPFTIESDRSPNLSGAKKIFNLNDDQPGKNLLPTVKLMIVYGSQNLQHLMNNRPEKLIVIGHYEDALTQNSDLVLPATMFYETAGTYTNKNGLTQKFNRAIIPAGDIKEGWKIIQDIANALDLKWNFDTAGQIAKEMMDNVSGFQNDPLDNLYPNYDEHEMIF
jgi:NADH-quinone oxidoreductase subunit G